MSGRPGTESTVTLTGSGFMEGASTITVGGVVTADDYTNISPDVYGSRNDQLAVVLPRTIEGTVRVTTEGGYAEVKVPTNNSSLVASFTGIAATAQAGAANLLGTASANAGQTIKLLGLGLTYSTLVEFEGVDDTGKAGIITRQVLTANGAGTEATIAVPALARTGQVRVVGAAGSQTLQVVPTLRSLGGTVAAGNTLIIEGTGLVTSEIVVQVDGRAVGNFAVRTMSDGSDYYYYYYDSQTPEANQQLLTLTLPNGVSNPVVTVSTVGGTATLRLGRAVDSAAVPVAGDPGDTIATAAAVALNPGQLRTLSSKIGDTAFGAGDVDLYSVTLAQGDTLSLDLVSGAPANYVRLFDSKGAEVAYQYFTASTASYSFRVKDAGQYFVGVSSGYNYYYDATKANSGSNFGVTGDYTLSLERIGAGQSSLAAIDTKAASGTAAQGGVASANVGQTITLLGSGLRADDQVFFTTIDESGRFSSQSVAPNTVAADGGSLTVVVPMSATTGMVRLGREGAGVLLQIVPTVNDVAMSYVGQAYNGGPINIRGTGFAEGITSVWFGGRRLADSGRVAGLDVTYDSLPGGSVTNGLIATTVPNGVPAGPISVSTVGGTSAVLPRSFTLLSVVAESGTPADAGQASANVGQSVELTGTGLSLLSGVIFETIDDGGGRGQVVVNPWFANAGGTQIKVTVPPNAATGLLRLVGDQTATAALLQIVPTLRASDVESLSNNGNTARVTLHGSGFVEGNNSEYHFGNTTVFDGSASTGANVYGGAAPDYLANGRVSLDVPVSDAALGGITVRTDGGTSAPLTFGLSAVSAVALSGTPANAGQASANPGQVVTLTGTRLAADTDVLFSYTASDGTSQRVIVNPVSVNAAGTSATILVPEQANGIARLQILGTAAVRTLQIVPTISGLNPSTNGTIQIYGAGFTEGASSVQFLAGAVKDADTSNTTFDVYSATGADNSGIQVVEPGHGLGNVTVTTAGGTSAPKALNEAQTKLGALRGIAIDGSTIWVVDDANPASVHQVSIADGKAVGAALPINSKDFGNSTFFGGLQVVPADFTLGATQVKAGSLLLVNGWAANDRVTAMNPSDGTTIATLTLAKNYDSTASLYDPATGHLFVIDRSVGPNRIVEVDPVTGTEISGFNAPANADEAGLVLDPSGNTIWYASYVSRTIFELSKTGQVLRGFSAAAQGADDSEFTGIAFAADGRLLASTYQGRIYAFDVNRDEAMSRPTITSVTTVAAQGTPAQGGLPSANVGQVIEIVGTNFNAGTQVQFTTRDANGNAGIAVALPNEVNADGTRLQVTVPNLATTGDLRLSNVPVRDLGFSGWPDAIHRQVKLSFTADDATTVLRFADGGLEQDVNNESWGLDNIKVADGAITVFSDDFEGAAGAQWSESAISGSSDSVFTRFSGRFNNADQRLTLTGLTAGKTYSLTFDLYAFDSWDGGAHGDAFSVSADGVRLMSDTIAGYSPSSSQTFNSSAPVTLQVVPTVASTGGGPGSESAFAIYGSGFAEGGSTVTIGGRSYKDTATDSQPIDVSGARNDTITLGAPTALDGKIRITTAGGYAEIDGPVRARPSPSFFSGIEVPGLLSGVAAGAGAAANVGQNIVLIGQGFSSSTLVQFQAVDDTGTVGTITRGGSVNGDGTRLTITVPALARTGAVTVLGAADTQALQVVPRMRGVGGTIAAGNTILIDGTGFAANEVVVQVDGLAATVQRVTTTADSTTGSYYYAYSGYEEGMQQIMAVTVPAGIGNGVVTVTTSGGTSQVKRYDIAALPDLTPPADVGDTIAGSQTVTIATGQSLNVAAKIGDGSFGNKDVDVYRIDLTAGDLLRLTVSSNAGTYTHLRVFDAAGVEKAERYFSANSTDVVTFRPSAGGTYYVGVSGYSNTTYDPNVANSGNSNFDTGAYNLAIRREQEGATSLTGITTTAAAGTPAQATVPSANPGQSITITGSGLLANDRVVFEVQSGSGYPTTVTVTPTLVAADGASLTVVVPDAAITGMVRLQRESAGLVLQVVPVLLDVGANPNNEFYGYYVTLTGRGFVDGATTLSFGGFQFVDPSRGTGPTVSGTTIAGKYVENGSLQTDMPNGVAAGPISVTTIGGTSNVFDMTFTGISAVAAAGTPADAGLASANPGQTITLTGAHFAMDTDIVFETATDGGKATIVVRPTAVAADGSSAAVVVPDAATTGMVRVFGDSLGTEVFLQVVPVVTGADFLNFQGDSTYGQVRLKGRGFVEGNWSTYIFGTSMYDDAGPSYGANVFAGDPDYRGNGTADISISFEDGSFGPIQVRTQGGTSAPFTRTVNGITATAASGTPANPAEASANPGQEVTVTGAGLTAQDEFFIGWRESYSGALRNQIVTPKAGSVAADGSSLVLVVPENANGAFRVRLLGASGAPLLQIVPVVTGYDVNGGNLILNGKGFLEGAATYTLGNTVLTDTAGNVGPDVYYDGNDTVQFGEPAHGFGPLTVTTAGGTSAPFQLNEATLPYGYLRDVAFDAATGDIWVTGDSNQPGRLRRIDLATGTEEVFFDMTAASFGSNQLYAGGLQVAPAAFILNGVNVPQGSLLIFNGYASPDLVVAMNPTTGAVIASLSLGLNYDVTAGVYDPATGSLFVLDRRNGPNKVVEIDPTDGTVIASFDLPFNAGEAGLAIDPLGGSLWYGSDQSNSVVELSKTGAVLRTVDLSSQGVNNNEINGLAFDNAGKMIVASRQGRVFKVTLPAAP